MASLDDFRQLPQYKISPTNSRCHTESEVRRRAGEIAQVRRRYKPQRNPFGRACQQASTSSKVSAMAPLALGLAHSARKVWPTGPTGGYAKLRRVRLQRSTDLERIEDQSLGSALPFLGYQVAKQVPMLAGTLAASAAVPQSCDPCGTLAWAGRYPERSWRGRAEGRDGLRGSSRSLEAGNAFGRTIAASYPIGVGAMYGEAVEAGRSDTKATRWRRWVWGSVWRRRSCYALDGAQRVWQQRRTVCWWTSDPTCQGWWSGLRGGRRGPNSSRTNWRWVLLAT